MLENGTYEEIVALLERELELNALEESDDLPMPTIASTSAKTPNLLSGGIDINKNAQCPYCKDRPPLEKLHEIEKETENGR